MSCTGTWYRTIVELMERKHGALRYQVLLLGIRSAMALRGPTVLRYWYLVGIGPKVYYVGPYTPFPLSYVGPRTYLVPYQVGPYPQSEVMMGVLFCGQNVTPSGQQRRSDVLNELVGSWTPHWMIVASFVTPVNSSFCFCCCFSSPVCCAKIRCFRHSLLFFPAPHMLIVIFVLKTTGQVDCRCPRTG